MSLIYKSARGRFILSRALNLQRKKRGKMNILTKFIILCFLATGLALAKEPPNPVDGRESISADALIPQKEDGVWATPLQMAEFPFEEAIYSWNAQLPADEGFRLYIRIGTGEQNLSPWIYAGFWGKVKPRAENITTSFEDGKILYDHVLLKNKATSYQFRVESEGDKKLSVLPSLQFVYTDNYPSTDTLKKAESKKVKKEQGPILDIPFRSQLDSKGNYIKDTCQSAALAAALEYFGKKTNLEEITPGTYDSEYSMYGIWPRVLATAAQLGFKSYIDRFRDWDYVRATLAENKVILVSITMPKDGDYKDPPYPSMGGHIIVLNGVTKDGRAIVTDSALTKRNKGYRLQWLLPDFEKVWMKNKGGVGMVICPLKDSVLKEVKYLPRFKSYKKEKE
jgi:hypothetical protein